MCFNVHRKHSTCAIFLINAPGISSSKYFHRSFFLVPLSCLCPPFSIFQSLFLSSSLSGLFISPVNCQCWLSSSIIFASTDIFNSKYYKFVVLRSKGMNHPNHIHKIIHTQTHIHRPYTRYLGNSFYSLHTYV